MSYGVAQTSVRSMKQNRVLRERIMDNNRGDVAKGLLNRLNQCRLLMYTINYYKDAAPPTINYQKLITVQHDFERNILYQILFIPIIKMGE